MSGDRNALRVAAALLEYPPEGFTGTLSEARSVLPALHGDARAAINRFLDAVQSWTLTELQAHYAEVFDFRKECALYLSYQEAGEERERARLLLELQEMLWEAGYQPPQGELPDYLPMLLEFQSLSKVAHDGLGARLQAACRSIGAELAGLGSPYREIFLASCAALPKGEVDAGEDGRPAARAGEEDLPYPLHFG